MTVQIIQPKRQRGEMLFLLIASISILLVATTLLLLQQQTTKPQKLKSYQINALENLGPNDLVIFTDLYGQATEVERLHFTNREIWPTMAELENQLIPPFAKDAMWEQRGKLSWSLIPNDRDEVHFAAYIGKTSDESIASSFLLLFEHFHTLDGAYYIAANRNKSFSVWVKPGAIVVPTDFSAGALIKDGWFEVIPLTGGDESKKYN